MSVGVQIQNLVLITAHSDLGQHARLPALWRRIYYELPVFLSIFTCFAIYLLCSRPTSVLSQLK